MKRYIEAEALIKVLETSNTKIDGSDLSNGYNEAMIAILRALIAIPTADVEEVRHGTWYHGIENGSVYAKCSACGMKMDYSCYGYAYCSLCGAKMDGRREG